MHVIVRDAGLPTPSKKCPVCSAVLEVSFESCSQCGAKVDQEIHTAPYKERQSFKPYLDINTDFGKEVYERLTQAFSEIEPRERPWFGIGVTVDLLAVGPRGVTVARMMQLSGIKKAVVRVPQNWRQPWYVEAVDSEECLIQGNPCEQAGRSIRPIKDNLESFLKAHYRQSSPRVKCLIIFPDGYDLEGPRDFSVLQRDTVVTLNLRNFRDLPEAILQPTQQERLDSRKYRKWIKSGVLRSKEDSILGTWLDPAFDKVESEPPKGRPWRLRRPRHQEVPAEEEELSSSHNPPTRPNRRKFSQHKLKLTTTFIAGMIIVMAGWRLYRSIASVSYSPPPLSSPRPENLTNATEIIQAPMSQDIPSSPEHEPRAISSAPETTKPSGVQETESKEKDEPIKGVRKPRSSTQAPEHSELKRQKIERQIHHAIVRRAITGVKIYFIGDIAYLQGQVQTENQKSAAEKAARSVPGIKEVRNSIEVNRLLPADG